MLGGIDVIEYVLSTARGSTTPPADNGAVAVIDGQIVKITPFRTANIPPPMALHELEVPSNAVDVSFNADASLIAVLHAEGISMFEWKNLSMPSSATELTGRVTLPKSEHHTAKNLQIGFAQDDSLLVLQKEGSSFVLKGYNFDDDSGRMEEISSRPTLSSTVSDISTLGGFSQDGLIHPFVQDKKGGLHSLAFGDQTLSQGHFPMYLPWVDIVPFEGGRIAFGMSRNGHLYANSRLLVKNCTSFLVTPAHLIFTTTTHLLKFVHITNVHGTYSEFPFGGILTVSALEVPPDDPEVDERCRSIERGARLVTAMPTALSVVLQMPRGNLETIFPRAMVLAGIRKLVDEKNYKKAFTHCRTQRVDMNLLYDHAPAQFLSNVELFIDQVKKISYVDLFLSSLRYVT